ncbi:hypothetical protein ACFE04_031180 [Oxalis oulophora]
MKAKTVNSPPPLITLEHKRDAYGFAVRPQHVQRYREYANIYKEEEEERSDRWKNFLEQHSLSAHLPVNGLSSQQDNIVLYTDITEGESVDRQSSSSIGHDSKISPDNVVEKEKKKHMIQIWAPIRPSLGAIEDMMGTRVKKKTINQLKNEQSLTDGAKTPKGGSEDEDEDSDDEFYDVERSDPSQDASPRYHVGPIADDAPSESPCPWKEELEVLVRDGVPMCLRGELWQAFVGVKSRRVEKYYQDLLAQDNSSENIVGQHNLSLDGDIKSLSTDSITLPEKWKGQIEKDLPRTFPGHPALEDDGRNALRRLLTAYARHNPSVGYCQAMNFFAGLLLLLMPEENAFWTLVGILDDYFAGYYSEEMIESQVDQLVFDELVRERFPKLVNHLDYLGVQVAWVSGPWFLSIFMNMLPWESGQFFELPENVLCSTVLRIWDVLLYEGNRVMLFRTALGLMELYGPALVTTKDAGDAITLLQSLASSTFDSSQLVLTACMGYQNVTENRLNELRNKHRPAVITALEERARGLQAWRDSQGLASKLYSFKHDPKKNGGLSRSESGSTNPDDALVSLTSDLQIDSVPDLQEQVVWLKVELSKLLEEKRSAEVRAEELETALMEMVKQDNRRELSAKVEQLEQEVADLQRALADKQEQESVMLQVLMRVEQEQKVTEDARRYAEQDASAQRHAAQVSQEKYEETMASLAAMEKRAVMAESMLEATLQYQSGQLKTQPSPRTPRGNTAAQSNPEPAQEVPARKISLLSLGLSWRDRSKGKAEGTNDREKDKVEDTHEKPTNIDSANNGKSMEEGQI